MQRILESVKQAFGKSILILALMSLISLSSLFISATQPSLAATTTQKPIQQQNIDIDSQNSREQAYEEQVKAAIQGKIAKVEKRGYKVSDFYFGAKTEHGYDFVVEFKK